MEIKKPTTPKKKKKKKAQFKSKPLTETSPKFQRLQKDMKTQPKDASGKFVNRTFAEYAKEELAKIRKTSFLLKEKAPKKVAAKTPKKTK